MYYDVFASLLLFTPRARQFVIVIVIIMLQFNWKKLTWSMTLKWNFSRYESEWVIVCVVMSSQISYGNSGVENTVGCCFTDSSASKLSLPKVGIQPMPRSQMWHQAWKVKCFSSWCIGTTRQKYKCTSTILFVWMHPGEVGRDERGFREYW